MFYFTIIVQKHFLPSVAGYCLFLFWGAGSAERLHFVKNSPKLKKLPKMTFCDATSFHLPKILTPKILDS
jgi:hypothetical protein